MATQNQVAEVLSEEVMQSKMLKARRRRQQAEEKKEKDKKQTIERLLKKKQEDAKSKRRKKMSEMPKVTYINNQNGVYICLPNTVPFELVTSNQNDLPTIESVKCAREGCTNRKKYSCSKTKLPLCSLDCYKAVNNG